MPIITNNPVNLDGKTYDKLGVNLSISPMWNATSIGASVAMRLVPYRYDENGQVEKLDQDDRAVVYLDVFQQAQNDPELAAAVNKIMEGIQDFITAKNV